MIDGDPGADVWGMDVARYGDWTTLAYTNAKVRENYSRRFSIRFPNEELHAARPLRTTPIYERLQAEHAVFGDYCALEHPLWFAPSAQEAHDEVSFRRSNAHPHVAEECIAVRDSVGLLEISNYGKFDIQGPGAAEWLSHTMANRVPGVGRIVLTPMLNERGKLIGDFTVCRASEQRFFLIGTYAAETYYMRWFERHMPSSGVSVRPCAMEYTGLAIAGPNARALLQGLVRDDLSSAAFPFMSFRRMEIGMVPGYVGRVSFTGEQGFEIWVTADYQPRARPQALWGACPQCHAHREELWDLGARVPSDLRPRRGGSRAFRRLQEGPLHRSYGSPRRARWRRSAQAFMLQGSGQRCGRHRR
jgi:dimethylglycine dehydrogenase